jgi:hypothetical protein
MANVVGAFHDDEVLDAGLGDDVAVEADETAGASAVMEDAVTADTLVEDTEACRLFVRL